MDPLELAEDYVAAHPLDPDTPVLQRLLQSLHGGDAFNVHELYDTSLSTFDMALEVLQAWRLQRYYRGAATTAARHVH